MATDTTTSITLGSLKRELIEALGEAFIQAREPGWEGYEGVPVDPATLGYALHFLTILPYDLPLPEIAVDNDGDIAVEWDLGRRRVFSVRISRDGTLYYAGLVGHRSFYGTELLREAIPSAITDNLERVLKSTQP